MQSCIIAVFRPSDIFDIDIDIDIDLILILIMISKAIVSCLSETSLLYLEDKTSVCWHGRRQIDRCRQGTGGLCSVQYNNTAVGLSIVKVRLKEN